MKNFLVIICICFSLTSFSQIQITSLNMPVSGDTIRYSSATLSSLGDYTVTGTNFIWDYSTLDSVSQDVRKFEAALTTPYFYFGINGYGEKISDSVGVYPFMFKNIYNFYKKSTTQFYVDGLGLTYSGVPIPNFYTDKDELYKFPLNYGNRDSTTFKFSTVSTGTIPAYSKQGYRITEADGWGTITTPYGTAPCLRVVTTQYSQDSVKGVLSVGTFTLPLNLGFPNYSRSYQWLTLTEKIPYLEVTGKVVTGSFTPNQVKYRDTKHDFFTNIKNEHLELALSVFPNPSTSELSIIVPKSNHSIRGNLIDLQGKVVLNFDLEGNTNYVNTHKIDVFKIAKGLYILNLFSENQNQSLKISIQ
jgi:hypothetical protein